MIVPSVFGLGLEWLLVTGSRFRLTKRMPCDVRLALGPRKYLPGALMQ